MVILKKENSKNISYSKKSRKEYLCVVKSNGEFILLTRLDFRPYEGHQMLAEKLQNQQEYHSAIQEFASNFSSFLHNKYSRLAKKQESNAV